MTVYTVVRGDNLSRIARSHGLNSWRMIYFHAANAAFRDLRPNPNRIYPGDVLRIPEAEESGGTSPSAQRPRQTSRHRVAPQRPTVATADRSDEQDLLESERSAIRQAITHDPGLSGSPHRGRASAWASNIPNAEQLRNKGVIAVLFGQAAIYGRGTDRTWVTGWNWDGLIPTPRIVIQSSYHNGSPLLPNHMVSTQDGEDALIVFLDTFTTIRLRENTVVRVPGPARTRRGPTRSVLRSGNLRERLHELRGGN